MPGSDRQRGRDIQLTRRAADPTAQCAPVIVSLMSVTAPFRASARRCSPARRAGTGVMNKQFLAQAVAKW
jgi:hypothetical protein